MVERYFREDFEDAGLGELGIWQNFSTKQSQMDFLNFISAEVTRDKLHQVYIKLNTVNECPIYLQTADLIFWILRTLYINSRRS